jgi:hypothetical protein
MVWRARFVVDRPLNDLVMPQNHNLQAAEGWFELGNFEECFAEIEKLEPRDKIHPDVLALRMKVWHAAGKLDFAIPVADRLIKHDASLVSARICLDLAKHCARENALKAAAIWIERAVESDQDLRREALMAEELKPVWDRISEV